MTKEELLRFLEPFMDETRIFLSYNGRTLYLCDPKYVPATESRNACVTVSLGDMEYRHMLAGHYNDIKEQL